MLYGKHYAGYRDVKAVKYSPRSLDNCSSGVRNSILVLAKNYVPFPRQEMERCVRSLMAMLRMLTTWLEEDERESFVAVNDRVGMTQL